MSKRKSTLSILLGLALVFSFSFGALAVTEDIESPEDQANQYVVSGEIAGGVISTDTLYIGTVADYLGDDADGSTAVFENGEAIHPDDIIIMNNKVGIVLAVGTRNPWGYPSGSILDAGRVNDADVGIELKGDVTFGRDTVWSVEFLMNGWDSWSPNNSGVVHFELVDYDFAAKEEASNPGSLPAVKVSRVFEEVGDLSFDVVTYYSIGPDNEYAYIYDTVKSNNDVVSSALSNRFSVTNKGDDGGAMARLDLLTGINSYGKTNSNIFATTLILPGENTGFVEGSPVGDHPWNATGGSVGYKELRAKYTYAAQEFRVYDEYLFIDDQADTAAVVDFLNDYHEEVTMTVSGKVYDTYGETPVSEPVVVVMQGATVFGWFIGDDEGNFNFELPSGDYNLYVERAGFAKGDLFSISSEGSNEEISLNAGEELVEVVFNVTDSDIDKNPLWARVEIEGLYPVVRFTGNSVFYAEDENSKGHVTALVPPGDWTAQVFGEGYYFYSSPETVYSMNGEENYRQFSEYNEETSEYDVEIDMPLGAPEGWMATDPHHHSNKNDAFALPEDVIRSSLAAGLDVAFTTDHDFTTNNAETYGFAQDYGMSGYIPSEEISASWAHFNVVPQTRDSYQFFLDEDQENNIMDQFADFKDFVQQAHEAGATITANHPYYSYGLFYTQENSRVPGGYDNSFDTIEINATSSDTENIMVINKAAELWSAYLEDSDVAGEPVTKAHYLLASSDTHDVLYPGIANDKAGVYHTGKGRTYAFIGDSGDMSTAEVGLATGQAIADGNSFATLGPILNPEEDVMFGEKYVLRRSSDPKFSTSVDVASLNGISTILLLSNLGEGTYDYNGQIVQNVLEVSDGFNDTSRGSFEIPSQQITYEINESIPTDQDVWFAIMVIDGSENNLYAISNPYWVSVAAASTGGGGGGGGGGSTPGEITITIDTPREPLAFKAGVKNMAYVHGYPDKTFRPNGAVTRAEVMAMFYNLLENSTFQANGDFKDLANVAWARQAILTLSNEGIVGGYPDGSFKPGQPMTRGEFSAVLAKIMGLNAANVVVTGQLTDVSGHWAEKSIYLLLEKGYIAGYPNGAFRPDAPLSRAEAVLIINRAIGAAGIGSTATSPFTDLGKSHWAFMEIMKAFYGK